MLDLPALLNIPDKLLPLITDFNNYDYFLIEGGRGSAKSQSVARILLYIAEVNRVKIMCGRETQNSIDESVYSLIKSLIEENDLAFKVQSKVIKHLETRSNFSFRGFREQGKVKIKGIDGVDILWIDEAETLTNPTLQVIIPTIRKGKSKVIFSMNRYLREDAVVEFFVGRKDCLHIKINYDENPHCPEKIKKEAEELRQKNEREYRHIYLGEPVAASDEHLFNYDKLYRSLEVTAYGEALYRQRILSIDFAAGGGDYCVATILDRVSNQHWQLIERIRWAEDDTMVSTGKIVNLLTVFKPDVSIIDAGGMGYVVHNRLTELKQNIRRFDGQSTMFVDTTNYANARAEAYYLAKDWFEQEFLIIHKKDVEVLKQLEKIKKKWASSGKKLIQEKPAMKKELGYSPDDADSLVMGIFAAVKYLGKPNDYATSQGTNTIRRISGSKRKH